MVLDVAFYGQDAFLARHDEDVVNQFQQLDVFNPPVARTLDQAQSTGEEFLMTVRGLLIRKAPSAAQDDHDFQRVPEQ